MDNIAWIDVKLALTLHKMQLARFGGASGVQDKNLLESALSRPIH
jgi:prophage maintenance system killer protein